MVEIGERFGLTRERILQMRKEALEKLARSQEVREKVGGVEG